VKGRREAASACRAVGFAKAEGALHSALLASAGIDTCESFMLTAYDEMRRPKGPGLVQPVGVLHVLTTRHPHPRHDLSALGVLNPLNTRSRASRLAKHGSFANHFRRRPPLELKRGMQRPSGAALRSSWRSAMRHLLLAIREALCLIG
jgi:hypothetical protein